MAVTDTSTTTTGRATATRARTSGWYRARRRQGLLYALPTAIYVAVFFVLPLLLVGRMSLSNWTLRLLKRNSSAALHCPSASGK